MFHGIEIKIIFEHCHFFLLEFSEFFAEFFRSKFHITAGEREKALSWSLHNIALLNCLNFLSISYIFPDTFFSN